MSPTPLRNAYWRYLVAVLSIVMTSVGVFAQEKSQLPARMASISEITVEGHKFNIIVIDDISHGALYSHRIPFVFPESFENRGWAMGAKEYMEFANDLSVKALRWLETQYQKRGLKDQGATEAAYLDYLKNEQNFLREPFSLVIITEANDIDKIVGTLRVTRASSDGRIPLERNQKTTLPKNVIWDEYGIPIQGPPVELKGLAIDPSYKSFVNVDWFNVLFMTVGPMVFLQEIYSPLRGRFEITVPDKLYLECYKKMIPLYEKIGFRYHKTSDVSDKIVIMEANADEFIHLDKLLQKHRGTLGQLNHIQFTKDFPKKWMPAPLNNPKKCQNVFGPSNFYHIP